MIHKFFVEGKEDKNFLKSYLEHIGYSTKFEIQSVGGKDNLKGIKNDVEHALDNGSDVSIIFDADRAYERTRNEIDTTLNGLNVTVFLFPDNRNSGILEDLLVRIIKPEHRVIFDCFEAYKQCINGYKLPDAKAQIYAYREAHDILNHPFDSRYWDFENLALNPLKNFLESK